MNALSPTQTVLARRSVEGVRASLVRLRSEHFACRTGCEQRVDGPTL